MGTDYNLKKIYEQMIKGEEVKSSSNKPKSLNEAYKQVVTERVAFYAKDVGSSENSPDIPGLENLGVVDNSVKIKQAITAHSLSKPLEELLKLTDSEGQGWDKVAKGITYDDIANIFVECGVSTNAVSKIVDEKENLKGLETAITSQAPFIMENVVVGDLVNKKVPAETAQLKQLFAKLFKLTASVKLASVGWGEIAATLLTNAKKGATGDLVFGDMGVELKASGGRLGKAGYAAAKTGEDLATFLKNANTKYEGETQASVTLKSQIREALNKIKKDKELSKKISPEYFTLINQVLSFRDYKKLKAFLEKENNLLTLSARQYLNLNLHDDEPNFPGKPLGVTPDAYKAFETSHINIRTKIKQLLKLAEETQGENVLDPAYLQKQGYNNALKLFFMHDIGLTAEQAAYAFTTCAKTIALDNNELLKTYGPAIQEYFKTNYESLKSGNLRALHAIIFAYSLALYVKGSGEGQHFSYFLMVDNETTNSIAINVSVSAGEIIKNASDLFLRTPKMTLSVVADERGGSRIYYGGEEKSAEE